MKMEQSITVEVGMSGLKEANMEEQEASTHANGFSKHVGGKDVYYEDSSTHESDTFLIEQQEEAVPFEEDFGLKNCIVCHKNARTHIFVPCGHLCACGDCCENVMAIASCCPMCGIDADQSHEVFVTS